MKKIVTCVAVAVVCLASQLKAEDAATNRMSFVTGGDKTLIIVDAAASWNVKKKEMNVYLSPYKLTAQHLEDVKRGRGHFIGLGSGSDDLLAQIKLKFSKSARSLQTATFCNFQYTFFEKNFTANFNRNGAEVQKSIQKLTVEHNRLVFMSKGSGAFDEPYTWDLSVSCPILDIEEK
jgi:hypothetical protein